MLAGFCLKSNAKLINVSSGCIYDGTELYEEEDWPDFGLDSKSSSWYSRTKHAAELSLNAFPNVYTLRIRMPVCNDFNSGKNYLTKILKYNNLLEETNSKTIIEDLINVINKIVNIPDIPIDKIEGVKVCRQGTDLYAEYFEKRVDPRNRTYYWQGCDTQLDTNHADTDGAIICKNCISITPIKCDMTDYNMIKELEGWKLGT